MTITDISRSRLHAQQLTEFSVKSPADLVSWMGAIQAQDFSMACRAIGIRLKEGKEDDILASINRGEIIRTHVLRPTWHFVAAADLGWMLRLTGPAIKRNMLSSERTVGLDEKYFTRSTRLIEKYLQKNGPAVREELKAIFVNAGLETGMNLPAHMLMHAELDGVICSGPMINGKTSYTLRGDWVTEDRALSREESLKELAFRYFSSHGPASLRDFSWWSGLNLGDSRKAVAMIKPGFSALKVKGEDYWFSEQTGTPHRSMKSLLLLPAYDEYIISYKDRSAVLPSTKFHSAVSSNGVFRPVILMEGKVVGTWKRTTKKKLLQISIFPFSRTTPRFRKLAEEAARSYGEYAGLKVMVRFD
jgi:hypothetical protein